MLQFIFGRPGYGKTHAIIHRLAELARQDDRPPLILLVPEQFSFESERALLEQLGASLAPRVQVLSFSRLAENVFAQTGQPLQTPMDGGTRTLLMSQALEQVADQLTLYRRQVSRPDCIPAMLDVMTEFKRCCIPPASLEALAEDLGGDALGQKTAELALILNAYDALAAQSYLDEDDVLTLLAERLSECDLLDGAVVMADAFRSFTPQELRVLEVLMMKSSQLTVALCADGPACLRDDSGLFAPTAKTAQTLMAMAAQHRIPVDKPVVLTEDHRSNNEALRVLCAQAFSHTNEPMEQPTEEVVITAAPTVYAECEQVARTIRRLLRTEGMRCRDFAVVVRNLSDYAGVLDAAFEREQIPFYMDRREDVLTEPLITLVLSALKVVTGGYATDELLRLMKTGLLGLDAETIAETENYLLLWRIGGAGWKQPWVANPSGLAEPFTDECEALLERLNEVRERVVLPLERLRAALAGSSISGLDFAKAVYRYLTAIDAAQAVEQQIRKLSDMGEPALAERAARLWDTLSDLLGRFPEVLGERELSADRMADLFTLMLSTTDLGVLPQGLDTVQIGSADRMRFSAPKAVFILGANEGVFPAYPDLHGLLTERERRRLALYGVPLTKTGESLALEERLSAYLALTAASERLYISYPVSNGSSEALFPSSLVETVRRILPACTVMDARSDDQPGSPADAVAFVAAHQSAPTPQSVALEQWMAEAPDRAHTLDALRRAADDRPWKFDDDRVAKQFFGDDMLLSASRTDRFYQCRFAYFCQYGLKLRVPRTADLDAMQFGTLVHYVMENQLRAYAYAMEDFGALPKARVMADAAARVDEYAEAFMGGVEDKPARFLSLLNRLKQTAGILLWRVLRELAQSRFYPVAYELPISPYPDRDGNDTVESMVFTLPDGARVRMVGKVDRVDVCEQDGVTYVRVVDYKTGSKDFRLSEVVEGLNLQMLIYLLSICQNGGRPFGPRPEHDLQPDSSIQPAGVLYLPAALPLTEAARGTDTADAEQAQLKQLRMNGLLLDDPAILRAMESDLGGVFIPAHATSSGALHASSSVATLHQFGLLKKRIEKLLCGMAQTLRQGDIAAVPVKNKQMDACEYCDFRAVCGHEQDGACRRFDTSVRNKDVFAALEQEQTEDAV